MIEGQIVEGWMCHRLLGYVWRSLRVLRGLLGEMHSQVHVGGLREWRKSLWRIKLDEDWRWRTELRYDGRRVLAC